MPDSIPANERSFKRQKSSSPFEGLSSLWSPVDHAADDAFSRQSKPLLFSASSRQSPAHDRMVELKALRQRYQSASSTTFRNPGLADDYWINYKAAIRRNDYHSSFKVFDALAGRFGLRCDHHLMPIQSIYPFIKPFHERYIQLSSIDKHEKSQLLSDYADALSECFKNDRFHHLWDTTAWDHNHAYESGSADILELSFDPNGVDLFYKPLLVLLQIHQFMRSDELLAFGADYDGCFEVFTKTSPTAPEHLRSSSEYYQTAKTIMEEAIQGAKDDLLSAADASSKTFIFIDDVYADYVCQFFDRYTSLLPDGVVFKSWQFCIARNGDEIALGKTIGKTIFRECGVVVSPCQLTCNEVLKSPTPM